MTLQGLMLVALSALLTTLANLLLRAGILKHGGFSLAADKVAMGLMGLLTQPQFVAGLFFYGLAAVIWFSVLANQDLSVSYPMLVGLTFVLVAVGAGVFFGESFSWQKILGIMIILFGIVMVARA